MVSFRFDLPAVVALGMIWRASTVLADVTSLQCGEPRVVTEPGLRAFGNGKSTVPARKTQTFCHELMRTAESLRESVESGELSAANVSAAAALGDDTARDACDQPLLLESHFRTDIEQVCTLLNHQQCLTFSQNAAHRALKVWQHYSPDDQRPNTVYDACCVWMEDRSDHDFRALSNLASNASLELDYPELAEDVDPDRCRAMHAADAVGHFALAIDLVVNPDPPSTVAEIVAWIARFAFRAARDGAAEKRTIYCELVSLLLTPNVA